MPQFEVPPSYEHGRREKKRKLGLAGAAISHACMGIWKWRGEKRRER